MSSLVISNLTGKLKAKLDFRNWPLWLEDLLENLKNCPDLVRKIKGIELVETERCKELKQAADLKTAEDYLAKYKVETLKDEKIFSMK